MPLACTGSAKARKVKLEAGAETLSHCLKFPSLIQFPYPKRAKKYLSEISTLGGENSLSWWLSPLQRSTSTCLQER